MRAQLVTLLVLLLCFSTVHSISRRSQMRVLDDLEVPRSVLDDADDDDDMGSLKASITSDDLDSELEDSGEDVDEDAAEDLPVLKKTTSSHQSAKSSPVAPAAAAPSAPAPAAAAASPAKSATTLKAQTTSTVHEVLNGKPKHPRKHGVGPACKGVRDDGSCRPAITEVLTSEKRKLAKMYAKNVKTSKMTYHGGPILVGPVNIYYIFYGEWVQANPASGPILVDLARHLGNSAYHHQSLSFFQLASHGQTRKNNSQSLSPLVNYGGSYYINSNHSLYISDKINDEQIHTLVGNSIEARPPGWPADPDPNGVYFLLLSVEVKATSGLCTQYCAFHNAMHLASYPATLVKYAVVGNPASCPNECAFVRKLPSPNADWAVDALASTLVNQFYNILTDPDPEHDAWVKVRGANAGHENADVCAWTYNSTKKDPVTGARYNVEIGPRKFLLNNRFVLDPIPWRALHKAPTNRVPLTGYCGVGPEGNPAVAATAVTSLTLIPSSHLLTVGAKLTLNVKFSAATSIGSPDPTGNIQLHQNGRPFQTYRVGDLVYTSEPLPVGAYIFKASYSGDAKYRASYAIVRVTVSKGRQAQVTLKTSKPVAGQLDAGTQLALEGTVTGTDVHPVGTVTIFSKKLPVIGCTNLPLSPKLTFSCSANIDTPGTHRYKARYNGDANYDASDSEKISVNARTATALTLEVKFTPIALGQPGQFVARISGAGGSTPSSGTVSFYIDDVSLKNSVGAAAVTAGGIATFDLPTGSIVTGTHFMYAAYTGSADQPQTFGPSSFTTQTLRFVINPALIPTKIQFSALPSTLVYGQTVSLSASIKPRQASNFVVTGTVAFTANGIAAAPVTVAANAASATFQVLSVPLVVKAHYSGDPHFVSSKRHISTAVNVATTSVVASTSVKTAAVGTPVTLSAQVTPQFPAPLTGVVTFFANNVQVGLPAAVTPSGEASLLTSTLAPGKYAIQAIYKDTLGHFSGSNSPETVQLGAPELIITGEACFCAGPCPTMAHLQVPGSNEFAPNSTVLTSTNYYDNFAMNLPAKANVTVLLTSTRGTTEFYGSFSDSKVDQHTQTAAAGTKLNFGVPSSGGPVAPYYFEAFCVQPRCRYSLQVMYFCPTPCTCGAPGSYPPPEEAQAAAATPHPYKEQKQQRPADYKTHLEATYFHNTGQHLNAPEPLEPAN
uniref:Predicted protein n=1 Tax=Hordeum vulgare subsp. vulgare TaxID=112509 RepID=F2DFK4_HORVV|nr:predicted protein [Hordeum vulgare subsp. vulgare]